MDKQALTQPRPPPVRRSQLQERQLIDWASRLFAEITAMFVRPIDSVLYGTRVSFCTVDMAAGGRKAQRLAQRLAQRHAAQRDKEKTRSLMRNV